jgi:ribosomal protein S18 acetylase RimI-like enzyme
MVFRQRWKIVRGALWVMELTDGDPPTQVSPHVSATFGEVDRRDARLLATVMRFGDDSPVLRRFDAGRRCVAAWVDGDIAAYGWISQSGVECIGELDQPFRVMEGEAYIWDCATLEPYRNRHLYRALLSRMAIMLRGEGTRRVWICAMQHNLPSIRGMMAAGFQPVVTMTYTRLFALRQHHIAGDATASPELVAAARQSLTPDPWHRTFRLSTAVESRKVRCQGRG